MPEIEVGSQVITDEQRRGKVSVLWFDRHEATVDYEGGGADVLHLSLLRVRPEKGDRVRHQYQGDGRVLFRHGPPFANLLTIRFDNGTDMMVRDDLLEVLK